MYLYIYPHKEYRFMAFGCFETPKMEPKTFFFLILLHILKVITWYHKTPNIYTQSLDLKMRWKFFSNRNALIKLKNRMTYIYIQFMVLFFRVNGLYICMANLIISTFDAYRCSCKYLYTNLKNKRNRAHFIFFKYDIKINTTEDQELTLLLNLIIRITYYIQ